MPEQTEKCGDAKKTGPARFFDQRPHLPGGSGETDIGAGNDREGHGAEGNRCFLRQQEMSRNKNAEDQSSGKDAAHQRRRRVDCHCP